MRARLAARPFRQPGPAIVFIAVPACARLIDQQAPPAVAWIVIAASAPAMLVADGLWKRRQRPTP